MSIPIALYDSVSSNSMAVDLKKFVAAKIGRQVHEILLKRQSERPFRDELTLLDYSISNGAQIDLEVDTGD